jgi:3-oxoacyl-[acyl-carrier protein] reductase
VDLGLAGRTALVAASRSGLGRAIAEDLAHEGVHLVLCARSAGPLEEARAQIADEIGAKTGVRVLAVAADLSEASGVARVVDAAKEAFGHVDILVTNTGGPPAGPFESHSLETWRHAVRQNLESVILLVQGVLPGMKERRWGRILNITSIAVKQPVDGLMLSNSIRAAVTGFARTLANEVAQHGITVNNLLPGYTLTERMDELADHLSQERGVARADVLATWEREIPMGRIGQPRELAALAVFLASERASYVTAQSIAVDGGWIRSLL